jgi:hypothetical protein
MTIAVDFDGTIVEHRYPEIGKEIPFATATLRRLMDDGHRLILWSVREGQLLDDAVEWCRQRGVEFYAVNQNFEGDVPGDGNSSYSRKLKVQLFIDDRNIGGLPDWGVMYELIRRRITYAQYLREQQTMTDATPRPKKKSWWKL